MYENDIHVGYCGNICEGGFTWCLAHKPTHIRDSLNGATKVQGVSLAPSRVIGLIRVVHKQSISLVAYFEHRWRETDWACSLDAVSLCRHTWTPVDDTLDRQADQQRNSPNPAMKMGMIRFHKSFEEQWEDVSLLLQRTLTKERMVAFRTMDTMVCEVVGSGQTHSGQTFLRLTLTHVPLHRWGIGLVVSRDRASYISIDMHRLDYESMFDMIRDNENHFKRCLVYVSAQTADHVQDLVHHRMYDMETIALHIDLEGSAVDAAHLLFETLRPEAATLAQSACSCFLLYEQMICHHFSFTDHHEKWAQIQQPCATYVTVKQKIKGHHGGAVYKADNRTLYVDHNLDGYISKSYEKYKKAHIKLHHSPT